MLSEELSVQGKPVASAEIRIIVRKLRPAKETILTNRNTVVGTAHPQEKHQWQMTTVSFSWKTSFTVSNEESYIYLHLKSKIM